MALHFAYMSQVMTCLLATRHPAQLTLLGESIKEQDLEMCFIDITNVLIYIL